MFFKDHAIFLLFNFIAKYKISLGKEFDYILIQNLLLPFLASLHLPTLYSGPD